MGWQRNPYGFDIEGFGYFVVGRDWSRMGTAIAWGFIVRPDAEPGEHRYRYHRHIPLRWPVEIRRWPARPVENAINSGAWTGRKFLWREIEYGFGNRRRIWWLG